MNEADAVVSDTTQLRQVLAPQLVPHFTRILMHAQEVRDWATQATAVSDGKRVALLEQVAALEQVAEALTAGYAASQPQQRRPKHL